MAGCSGARKGTTMKGKESGPGALVKTKNRHTASNERNDSEKAGMGREYCDLLLRRVYEERARKRAGTSPRTYLYTMTNDTGIAPCIAKSLAFGD